MLEDNDRLAIEGALKDLRYGMVQLVVHEGKLVRIEKIERIRLDPSNHPMASKPTHLTGGS